MRAAMTPLRVLLVLAVLALGRGYLGSDEEIITRPGSDLLLPIRLHLTLSRTDRGRCDQVYWYYKSSSDQNYRRLAVITQCDVTRNLPKNLSISENGSLAIYHVTPEDSGKYRAEIYNSTGDIIQRYYYTVHVQVPVSPPELNVSCLQNGSIWISCRVEKGTKPNINVSVSGGSWENYSTFSNHITATVGAPGAWNVTCSAGNGVSWLETNRTWNPCPVPLSSISVTSSCLPDGSAEAVCSVNGSDPRYSWSFHGRSSSSHRITLPPPVSGVLRCDVSNMISNLSTSIHVSCPVPVSGPVLDMQCLQNGSAEISCTVKSGTDPSIILTVIGDMEVYNISSSERTVRVTAPPVSPPQPWNISCSAMNNMSMKSTNQILASCSAPLSPRVNVSCHINGSASVSCVLEKDQGVTYNWTVNGESQHGHSSRHITFTDEQFRSGPLNVTCTAKSLGVEESNTTQIYCPDETSCDNCLRNSIIGGSVALLVTIPPLFIAHWYILRGKKS